MKNLKKVLALVVVFSMMLCSVAFASFPDVAEDADYAVAVDTLAALGIVGGDDQGNFNPDNTITRAEFTKIVCEIQGLKGDANKGVTAFTDVPADHWASGYINMATNLKIINGMGDGTFAPEAPVTYEQAVKMLVVTLGYAPMAADRGGYPTGHLVVAQTYGMTKNVAAPAQSEAVKRSAIAQIVYNTIDTPMMEQTGFGANVTYEVKDGNGDRERTTLLTSKFDVVKLGGVVVANEKIALEGSAEKGEIALKYDNNYKSTNEDFELVDRDDSEVLSNIEIGETNADELFGLRVIAYVRDNGKGYELIAIVAEDGKNTSIEIELNDIDISDRTVTDEEGKLKLAYYEGDATKSTQLKIEDEYAVIWNSQESDATLAYIKELAEDNEVSAKLELVDWDDNGKYDLIKVSELAHFVVAEIDEEDYEIKVVDSNEKFYLDAEEADYTITIKNAEGEIIGFEDIKVGDVIAVVSDGLEGNIDEPITFIDIKVLGQSAVTGAVKATRDGEVKVDGTWYEVDAAYEGKALTLGSEGTFYIGSNGKIVAFDGTKAASGNYGMIVKTRPADEGSWDGAGYEIKILDAKGQVTIYDVAEKVKVRNNSDDEIDPVTVKLNDAESKIAANYFDGTVFAAFDGAAVTLEGLLGNFTSDDEVADNAKYQRMIQFKVNSSNEVTEIAPAVAFVNGISDKYDADDKDISTVTMDSATVIFNVKNDIEDGKVVTIDSLLNDADYTIAAFGYDDDTETYGAVAILDGGSTLTTTVEGWAVVTAKSEIADENDATAYAIEIVENGSKEAKTIYVTEDTVVDADYNDEEYATTLVADEDFDIGSIILYSANAEGEVETFAVLANIVEDAFDVVADLTEKSAGTEYATTFAYGLITDEADTSFEIDDVISEGELTIKVRSTSNEYRYGYAGRKTVVNVGSYNGGKVKGIEDEDDRDTNYVFARFVNTKLVDIISIDVAVNLVVDEPVVDEPEA